MRISGTGYEIGSSTTGEIADARLNAAPGRVYTYDGLHRRIVKEVVNDTTYQYYYNESAGLRSLGGAGWQVVAVDTGEPNGGYPLLQYVWDVRYVDAPVALLCDGNQDGLDYEEPQDYSLYYCQDANFNVTALVAKDGSVAERYLYDPYGRVTFLEADWDVAGITKSGWDNEILFCGYRFDPESRLYHVRYRMYHPTLGRWMQRDPGGYVDSPSLYEYCRSSPTDGVDPLGEDTYRVKVEEWKEDSSEIVVKITKYRWYWYDEHIATIRVPFKTRVIKEDRITQVFAPGGTALEMGRMKFREIVDRLKGSFENLLPPDNIDERWWKEYFWTNFVNKLGREDLAGIIWPNGNDWQLGPEWCAQAHSAAQKQAQEMFFAQTKGLLTTMMRAWLLAAAVPVVTGSYQVAKGVSNMNAIAGQPPSASVSAGTSPRGTASAGAQTPAPSGAGTAPKISTKGFGNVSGGATTAENALTQAEKYLGPGYKAMGKPGSGVFRSADGTRQFRITTNDLTDPVQGPHVHFETVENGVVTENSHVTITNP